MRFGIVGSGWRVRALIRAARGTGGTVDVAALAARTPAHAAALAAEFKPPVYPTLAAMVAAEAPDFVLTSVPRDVNPGMIREAVAMGLPVLSETPPATSVEELRALWALVEQGARIQVSEQYFLQPHHAARLAFVQSGKLGRVSQVQVSIAHGYHGISLMRRFLGITTELPRVSAYGFNSPLVEGPGTDGPPAAEKIITSEQLIRRYDFGDRLGVMDFTDDQYFSWVRGQRLLVRGERGELIDDQASYLEDFQTPIHVTFARRHAGHNGNLEGNYLKGITAGEQWWYRNPTAPAELSDDEVAIASLLMRMADYVNGGPNAYSLAEACQDRYFDILCDQALREERTVQAEAQPWTAALARA